MKRYKTRPGHQLRVGPLTVTDDERGTMLPDGPTLREHVRLGRLIPVEPTPAVFQVEQPPEDVEPVELGQAGVSPAGDEKGAPSA